MLQNHPSSIHPSPARLGLTNPNSPSLPIQNATPAKFTSTSSQQQTPIATGPTTSSTLLSLLPPLSRAQSILVQMASLATKLFEVSSHRAHWVSAFRGALPTFLQSQPSVSLDPAPSSTKEILSISTSLQTQLFESVAQLQEILDLQESQLRVSREIKSKDSSLLAFTKKVHQAQDVLQLLLDDYADYCRPLKRCKTSASPSDHDSSISFSKLKLSDILSYAHRVSYTTFAPPEFGAGQAPLRGALPPAPQEEQMRASQLYNFADLDVGLPKQAEAKEKSVETLIEAPPPVEPPSVDPSALLGLRIPQMPVGWRPGMPIVLSPDWKPSDPFPLPPLDGLVAPASKEVDEQRPVVPMAVPKAPEPIQVRYVQLDINPDQDEYSSDYSSSGSSEDEEGD
ncbi:hypothetical protein H6P81_014727 [Aristolochia fimbriata]|uniref:Mediator of RNA polymerase II transcription subunit 4 n=1 Tax=Aristolochia fimbriata TaxID=158543 RepID=A0AAV7E6E6_ARIFI|nr:hypothetical protein H6P81_014727 [Aristolochia fimbriata]